jgi:hypothetical protein
MWFKRDVYQQESGGQGCSEQRSSDRARSHDVTVTTERCDVQVSQVTSE